MTIKKGEPWGEPAAPPAHALAAVDDRTVSALLEAARRQGESFPPVVVHGGDLGRTLGATGSPRNRFTVDVGEALVDGVHHYFVAHVVARGRGWRTASVAMNAQWLGPWNLGPKGHPNDGRLDVTEFDLQAFEWWKVRSRLGTGTHLPHPRIATRRTAAATFAFARPRPVVIDGEPVGEARAVAVRVLSDALTVYA